MGLLSRAFHKDCYKASYRAATRVFIRAALRVQGVMRALKAFGDR